MSSPSSQPDPMRLRPGDKLDKYEVVEQIGAGGTSVVWKGYDRLLDRYVAIKGPFLGGAADDEAAARAFRENAELQRRVSEKVPAVVRLIDVVEQDRGRFLVMEYVDGPTLEAVLASSGEPVKLTHALRTLLLVAQALSGVHAQGVIHRDVKPSNLLLPKGGGIKLCDLGLAALVAQQDALTLGSVKYMAPELCRGEEADGRADLYALGMVAYEMIAGRDRFNEAFKAVVRDQQRQAMRWIKWHTNPRLSAPPLGELNPGCPPWLGELVARLMEKDPNRRLASADEVVAVIERQLAAAGGAARPQTPAPLVAAATPAAVPALPPPNADADTAALPRRQRWPLIAAALGVVLFLGAAGLWLYDSVQRDRALAERRGEAAAAMRDAQDLYKSGDFAAAVRAYERVRSDWPDVREAARAAEAGVLLAGARQAMEGGAYDEARDKLLTLDEMGVVDRDEVYDLLEESDRRTSFARHIDEIEKRIEAGEFAQARRLIREWRDVTLAAEEEERLRELQVRLEDQVTQRLIDDELEAARRLAEGGGRDDAIVRLNQANQRYHSPRISDTLDELRDAKRFDEAVARGEAAARQGDWERALAAYAEALEVRSDEAIAERVRRLKSEAALAQGRRLLAEGDVPGARQAFARALGFGENTEAQAMLAQMDEAGRRQALVDAGDAAMRSGEYDAAATHYREAVEQGAGAEVEEKLALARATALVVEGERRLTAGDFEAAREAFAQARSISESVTGAGEGIERIARQTRYAGHLDAGDRYRAQSQFAEAKLEYLRAQEVIDSPDVRERLEDTEFNYLIAQARSFIAAEEWRAAEAVLKVAANIRSDDTVAALMKQVERRDAGGRPG